MLYDPLPPALERALVTLLAADEQALLAVAADMTEEGRYGERWLLLTNQRVLTLTAPNGAPPQPLVALPVRELKDIRTETLVGGGRLVAVHQGQARELLHYSNSLTPKVGEAARGLRQLAKGEPLQVDAELPRFRCATCGRRLPEKDGICPACLKKSAVIKRILGYLKPYWRTVMVLVLFTLAGTAAGVVPPYLSKLMMDRALLPDAKLGLTPADRAETLLLLVGALLAINLLSAVFSTGQGWISIKLGSRLTAELRRQVFNCVERLSLRFFNKRDTGALVSRVTYDTEMLRDFLVEGFPFLSIEILQMSCILGVLCYMSWELTCWVLLPTPILVLGGHWFWRRMRPAWRRSWSKIERLKALVTENFSGIRVVKAFAQEDREITRFNRYNQEAMQAVVRTDRVYPVFGATMGLAFGLGSLLMWLMGGRLVIRGEITIGTLTAFIGYMWIFYRPLQWLSQLNQWVTRAFTGAERVFELMDSVPEPFQAADAKPLPALRGKVEFVDVEFGYDPGKPVLKGINLTVAPGEMIGLVGKSGVGKTTIINLICRFYDVDRGMLKIDDMDVKQLRLADLRGKVGMVLQESFLFNGSILENIAYAKPDASFKDIVEAARIANAHSFILAKPDGYDTMVGERGGRLSTGEKQRIAIARAILHDPRILILDEATSAVDIETEKQIQEAIGRLVHGRTTFAIAHRLSTLRNANRLVVLQDGKIAELGTHDELMAKEGVFFRLVNLYRDISRAVAYNE